MELKIVKKEDNPLLARAEIEAEASFYNEATPKKEEIKKKISSMEKANEKLIVVKNIHSDFGVGEASILIYVYRSEDDLKKTEPKKKEKKGAKTVEGVGASEEDKGGGKEVPKEEAKKEAPEKEQLE